MLENHYRTVRFFENAMVCVQYPEEMPLPCVRINVITTAIIALAQLKNENEKQEQEQFGSLATCQFGT